MTSSTNNKKKIFFSYALITLIALLTRFLLLYNKDAWHDEWHTIYVSDPSINFNATLARYWGDKGDTFLTEYYPPLYLFLLKYFFYFFGYTQVVGNIFSIIFGTLTILLTLYLYQLIYKNNKFFFIGILLICNLFLLWHSLEIRAHSIVTFFSILSLILFVKILENPSLVKHVFYFFASIITITLWPITLTIYFAKCIFILKKYFQDKKFCWVLASNLIAIFIFYIALNYQYLFFNIARETHYTTIYETFFINYHFRSFFGSIFVGAVFLLVFSSFAFRNVKEIIYKNNYSNIVIFAILSAYFLTLLYSTIRAPIMAPKYVIFILPLILIFVSHQVEINKYGTKLKIILSVIIFFNLLLNYQNYQIKSPPLNRALNIIIENGGKNIITPENDVFNNYMLTKNNFIKNNLSLMDNKDSKNLEKINNFWFLCMNNPSFARGKGSYELPEEARCKKFDNLSNFKINRFIKIDDFIIKNYLRTSN